MPTVPEIYLIQTSLDWQKASSVLYKRMSPYYSLSEINQALLVIGRMVKTLSEAEMQHRRNPTRFSREKINNQVKQINDMIVTADQMLMLRILES